MGLLGLLTAIDTNLQSKIMHLFGRSIDPVRELVRVGDNAISVRIAVTLD